MMLREMITNEQVAALESLVEICGFYRAWIGKCTNSKPCPEHESKRCASCKEPADHECDETGMFVCGAPLCKDCEHTIAHDGTNGGIGFRRTSELPYGYRDHCRKDKQVYLPWYRREDNAE